MAKKEDNPSAELNKRFRYPTRALAKELLKMQVDDTKSWFCNIYPSLSSALQGIRGARLHHERKSEGSPVWFDSDPVWFDSDLDLDEDSPDEKQPSRSYHFFFVCPEGTGSAFNYETETQIWLEESLSEGGAGYEQKVETLALNCRTGWGISVCLLAPFAVITLGELKTCSDGSRSEPSIEFLEPEQIDLEAEFRKMEGENGFETLRKLRRRICYILRLSQYGITVLPLKDWLKPVVGATLEGLEEPVRKLDALFFQYF